MARKKQVSPALFRLKGRHYRALGLPHGPERGLAAEATATLSAAGLDQRRILARLAAVSDRPADLMDDTVLGALARALIARRALPPAAPRFAERDAPAPFARWGVDLDPESVRQMENACRLPVAMRGAIMPDAHRGYGLPIGGVLATRGAVIPYAVGVDIACRMKLTVLDMTASALDTAADRLRGSIERETRFGIGAHFKRRRQHAVLDRDWNVTATTRAMKDKAWAQLGTSGSGNHFVEFGVFTAQDDRAGLPAGDYLALLSHSGSRGTGASVASHYSKLAMAQHPELPRELRHLAWLDLDSENGQEYWAAMELMGRYAEANHACIHQHIHQALGVEVLLEVENHHNFAWKEIHDGEEVIVHRKGSTPAGEGVLGVIPGSMADAAYLVRGKGSVASLASAAHGAGRAMSRTQAKKKLDWPTARSYLAARRVTLISAGLDEVPMAYKNIETVMAEQRDLVEPLARFAPRLVKMAPAGERPED
jgi:tRNA-splicing ligase RtcB